MRVITSYGLGEVNDTEWKGGTSLITVWLEKPFCDRNMMEMNRKNVYIISDWAIVRVVNVIGYDTFSNLQFFPSRKEAKGAFSNPVPPDETVFLLYLKEGIFEMNCCLQEESIIIRPWMDQWAKERTEVYESSSEASIAFYREESEVTGTTGGIASSIHLEKKRILGFFITVPIPNGVVLKKSFAV